VGGGTGDTDGKSKQKCEVLPLLLFIGSEHAEPPLLQNQCERPLQSVRSDAAITLRVTKLRIPASPRNGGTP